MRGIVALLWNPGPLVLELRIKSLSRKRMKALPLALHQSVHVQPRQGSGTAGSPDLQCLEFVQSFVETSCEMGLVPGNLLQGLLVGEQALSAHPRKVSLYLLRTLLGFLNLPLGASYDRFEHRLRTFPVGRGGDLFYRAVQEVGGPALELFRGGALLETGHRQVLQQLFRLRFALRHGISVFCYLPEDVGGV